MSDHHRTLTNHMRRQRVKELEAKLKEVTEERDLLRRLFYELYTENPDVADKIKQIGKRLGVTVKFPDKE